MNNEYLADLIFPDIHKSIIDLEKKYPNRILASDAKVTRFAPSPTGFMHIGNFETVLINYILAKNSQGVFYLRLEDTDQKREIEGAFDLIMDTLKDYDIKVDEYEYKGITKGNYGPYIQSERKEIYHVFIKHLIKEGLAYPCFCQKEDLDSMRKYQEEHKCRLGYYGEYASCRSLKVEEAVSKIKAGIPYVIRFKSHGDNNKKFIFNDLVRGALEIPENDQDFVIMKSTDRLPTYHFAHFVDDYLMHTTHVVRGEEWLSSIAIHYELFKTFHVKMPKYIHIPLLLKKDSNTVRKISKRKDAEASMSYYLEQGYPMEAVIDSLMTIINSNFEAWRQNNLDKSYLDFNFSPKKMSATGGALYDIEKLNNISKNFISKLSASELYKRVLKWASIYDLELYNLLIKYEDYSVAIFNIERMRKNPRKDYINYATIKKQIFYMYDELFQDVSYSFDVIKDIKEIKLILKTYIENYYDPSDSSEVWFDKLKDMADKLGYASCMKDYKLNPSSYKGSIADMIAVIRVSITTKKDSPDLYEILKLLGKERILARFKNFY